MTVVDTSLSREIYLSHTKTRLLVFLFLMMLLFFIWFLTIDFSGSRFPTLIPLLLWCSVIFFASLLLSHLVRLLSQKGPVVIISPSGLWDTRLSKQLISWSFLSDIRQYKIPRTLGRKIVLIDLRPAKGTEIALTFSAKIDRLASLGVWKRGLPIKDMGLEVEHDELWKIIQVYFDAYKSSAHQLKTGDGQPSANLKTEQMT